MFDQSLSRHAKPAAMPWCVLLLLAAGAAGAQAFDSGSTGADGAIYVPPYSSSTLQVPPSGIFNATTLNVRIGSTLYFTPNARNTPVVLLCTGDVTLEGGLALDASGRVAGPGGFDGGEDKTAGPRGGDGLGPGGGQWDAASPGRGNHAGLTSPGPLDGVVYGSQLLMPIVGGSGGGASDAGAGGGGGGGVIIASSTRIVLSGGWVRSLGYGNGAAGSIRLIAPQVTGTGSFNVSMGTAAGHGRVRIDTPNAFDLRVTCTPSEALSMGKTMQVFPASAEKLELIHVGGQDIPDGTTTTALVTMAENAPTTQPVRVRVTNFTGPVTVDVVLTPRHAARRAYTISIPAGGNPRTGEVNVEFDRNMTTRVDTWVKTP